MLGLVDGWENVEDEMGVDALDVEGEKSNILNLICGCEELFEVAY